MIEWLGERTVTIGRIVLPGEIRQLTRLPRVQSLADSIAAVTLVNLPICRADGRRFVLLTGAETVAAMILLQRVDIRIRAVKCSDDEALMLTITEEAHRRGVTPEDVDGLVARVDAAKARQASDKAMNKRTRVAKAAEEVARAAGVDAQLLKRAYRQRAARLEPAEPTEVKPSIQDIGMPLDPEFMRHIGQIQYRVTVCVDALKRVGDQFAALNRDGLPFPRRMVTLAVELSGRIDAILNEAFPASLCPYCKGLAGIQEACLCCEQQGWIGKSKIKQVPEKLWDRVDRVVMVAGKATRVTDLIELERLK